jgi:uncharacterized Zn-binding protein involved in type VI secretion
MTDSIDHGGTIVTGAQRTFVDGLPAARMGDIVICEEHEEATIVTGSETVLIEGMPAARLGDTTSCGATIVGGSETVLVG